MQISTKSKDDVYIIEIFGRMDSISSKEIEAKLNDVIEHNKKKILIRSGCSGLYQQRGASGSPGSSQKTKGEGRIDKTGFFAAVCERYI